MTHLDIMAYLKAVKKEYCAFLQLPASSSVAHCPVQGECAQPICSIKSCFSIDITIEYFMMVSDFSEQSVILRPIAANFVWLKVVFFSFVPAEPWPRSLPSCRSLARSPSLLVDTVPCNFKRLEQPRLLSGTRLRPSRLSITGPVAAFQVYKAHI